MLCHIRICITHVREMKVKVPVQDAWVSRVRLLPPPPSSVVRSCWGGGGGGPGLAWGFWAGKGGSLASKYRELHWRLFLASKFSRLKSHMNPASCHGGFFWQVISEGDFGIFIWRVFMASKSSGFWRKASKDKRGKLCTFRGPVESHCKHCI